MIRRVLLTLFLYEVLVWTVSYLYAPLTVVRTALFWSALGVALLLIGLIAERFVSWWRSYRAKRATVSVPAAHPKAALQSEEAAAFTELIAQANARLAESPRQPGAPPLRLQDMPLYLLIGPSEGGKTALMQSCGIEPVPLAGQALTAAGDIATTRVGNIWLAGTCVFVEIAGRVFDADAARLGQIMSVLLARGKVARWSQLFASPQPAVDLRAALLCCQASAFMGEPDASKLDRLSQPLRERLGVLARSAGQELPVYVILTRADRIGGFPEFFGRSGPGDLDQVFGILNRETRDTGPENRVWADRESKRLGHGFQSLVLRLDERRRLALTVEGDSARKPAIYEFPREFKKLRTPLVQFLVDVFQPDPLRLVPRLAGFFFTGVLPDESPRTTGESITMFAGPGISDTTQIFQADRTVMLKRSGVPVDRERRAFAGDLFQKIVLHHRPAHSRPVAASSIGPQQRTATAVASGIALLLAIVWSVSWWNNRTLASDFAKAVAAVRSAPADLSLTDLMALNAMRQQLGRVDASDSLSRHWGLYQGGKLRQAAEAIYFERLKRVSLAGIDETLASQLLSAGAASQSTPAVLYDQLKTYRTISGSCAVDQPLVFRVLTATASQTHPELGSERLTLLGQQLDFYSRRLRPVPVRLEERQDAEEKARRYIREAGGVEPQFRSMVASLEQQLGKLAVRTAVDYKGLMDGPAEVSRVFTPAGLQAFEAAAAKDGTGPDTDQCVMGESKEVAQASTKDELKSRYYREYAAKWREFLEACNIRPFGRDEAARRLVGLADPAGSPLLGAIKLVAMNAPESTSQSETGLFQKGVEALKTTVGVNDPRKSGSVRDSGLPGSGATPTAKADLQTKLLQPALFMVPPPFDRVVNNNDEAYVKGLRDLANAIDGLARAALPEQAAKATEADGSLTKAREAQTGLIDKFSRIDPAGLADPLAKLLAQPLDFARVAIDQLRKPSPGLGPDTALRQLCTKVEPLLALYPFNSAKGAKDADLKNLKDAFAPKTGWIWKYAESNEMVTRPKSDWQEKPELPGYHVSQGLIDFLNAAQQLSDAFFPGGEPHFEYALRPCTGQPGCEGQIPIRLMLDGKEMSTTSVVQVQFQWPAATAHLMGADAKLILPGAASYGFGNFVGLWGVFRLFQTAERRPLGSPMVVWTESRGSGDANPQLLTPPVKLDLVGVTPRTDVLNPEFFSGLRPSSCPKHAIAPN